MHYTGSSIEARRSPIIVISSPHMEPFKQTKNSEGITPAQEWAQNELQANLDVAIAISQGQPHPLLQV
jgi:hypothetical protein